MTLMMLAMLSSGWSRSFSPLISRRPYLQKENEASSIYSRDSARVEDSPVLTQPGQSATTMRSRGATFCL